MKRIFTLVLVLTFLFNHNLSAQTTGSFQITVDFNEPDYDYTRNLYYFVPTDYDASQSYKLVVGFRGGPNSNAGQFRDQLSFLADSINAIVLCPENEDHFWNDEHLTKKLFQYSLDTTLMAYNIDLDYIYLTGLSYGGRHAVIVSMDSDAGPIPNLRGVIPFAAGSEADLRPNYEDIVDFPPACLCIGLSDSQNFINVSNNINNDIVQNNGYSMLNEISGVGHTVAFPTFPAEMMECINFIDGQYEEPVAIEETLAEKQNGITVFPNPAKNSLKIEFVKELSPTQMFISDLKGTVIKTLNSSDRMIDVSDLPTGIFLLTVHTDGALLTEKISISRD